MKTNRRRFLSSAWKLGAAGIFVPRIVRAQLGDPAFVAALTQPASASCSTLKDSKTTSSNDDYTALGNTSSSLYVATKFTTGSAYTLCGFELKMDKEGATATPTGDIVGYVYSNGTGPGTLLATSDAVASSSIPAKGAPAFIRFTFSTPLSLNTSSVYWLALHATQAANNLSYFGMWSPDTFISSGIYNSGDGSTWAVVSSRSAFFKTYA